jgi:sugar O-acyltransferase (sialic acid O-acetyltransferase NeuD family)
MTPLIPLTHLPCIMIGAGGHAKVILDELPPSWRVEAVVDAAEGPETSHSYFQAQGIDVWRESPHTWQALKARGITHAFVAIGDNRRRQIVSEQLMRQGWVLPSFQSPRAIISASAQISPHGVQVLAGALLAAGAVVGSHSIVNHYAVVEHDATVGDYVHLAPAATLLAGVTVASYTLVGAKAVVLPYCGIEVPCVIGAGAVVTKNLSIGGQYRGVPARHVLASVD